MSESTKNSQCCSPGKDAVTYRPRVDMLESDGQFTLLADLPGVKPEGLEIRFEDGQLIIHGRVEPRLQGGNCVSSEYGVGDLHRQFNVGDLVDVEKVAAELEDGVLKVTLPKVEAIKPRKIEVISN